MPNIFACSRSVVFPHDPQLTQAPLPREHGRTAADSQEAPPIASAIRLLNVLLRNRALIAGLAIAVFTFTAVRGLLRERTYTASASLITEGSKGSSPVSGLAAQLGIALPAGGSAQSHQFYVDLLTSREILRPVVETRYRYSSERGQAEADLATVFDVSEKVPATRRDAAVQALSDRISASVSARSGVISFTVTAPTPALAAQIATRIIEEVNKFNVERRQSAVRAERTFTERRLMDAKTTLRDAENRLQDFLLRNRTYAASPTLVFEHERLSREVASRQAIASFLGQAYEQSKIEEVRDTPVITVLESPEPPSRPDPRGALSRAILGLLVGAMVGVALAFAREWSRRTREESRNDYAEFDRLRTEAIEDVTHPWRPVARLLRASSGGRA